MDFDRRGGTGRWIADRSNMKLVTRTWNWRPDGT
jgi:hypothetical protein